MAPWIPSPSRRTRLLALTPLLALGLVVPATVAAVAPAPQPGPGTQALDTLFPSQGNGGYDVRSYDVALDYRPTGRRIDARAVLTARAHTRLASFHLDLEGLHVDGVSVDGRPARFSRHGHELVITPRRPVRGRFRAVVDYSGSPRPHTDADGSTEGWVRTPDGVTALGEPVGTSTWVPSNDTPGDKARWTFRLTVPSTLKAAANGVLAAKVRHGGRTTWVWREPEPMSPYLATISIGKFDAFHSTIRSVTGRSIPTWSFVDPSTGSSRAARRLLPKVIRFEERLFGPYPLSAAGMIVDNADVGYALETQTRPFYPFGTDTSTLVHETAHQWYGDSVTLTDWHDIWLAEGFATYAEWLWDAAHGGRTPAERFDGLYATADTSGLWHPAPTKFTASADLFGSPEYNRGAMTLQALRERVGTADFFRILRTWAREHRHGNVRTRQFRVLAEDVSGQDLTTLFADWLTLDGKPAGY